MLTAQNKMAIWTCGILRELILGTRYVHVCVRLTKLLRLMLYHTPSQHRQSMSLQSELGLGHKRLTAGGRRKKGKKGGKRGKKGRKKGGKRKKERKREKKEKIEKNLRI